MECNKVQEKFSEYIDGILSSEEVALVEEHLKTCNKCSTLFGDLKKTVEHIKTLEEVEPPSWLTQKVMAKIKEEAKEKRNIFEKLFYPLHIKIPIQAAATILIAIATIYVFKAIESDVKLTETPSETIPSYTIQKEKQQVQTESKRTEKPVALSKQAEPESMLLKKAEKKDVPLKEVDKIALLGKTTPAPTKSMEQPLTVKESEETLKYEKEHKTPEPMKKMDEAMPSVGAVVKEEGKRNILIAPKLKGLREESLKKEQVFLRFEDYPVSEMFKGTPAPIDFSSHPKAKTWETMLKHGVTQGPNFAGHYAIATWGCGTSCVAFGIIDMITGKVYFPSILTHVSWAGWWEKEYGLKFQIDSNLLIAYGSPNEQDDKGIFFYKWENNALQLLHSIIKR